MLITSKDNNKIKNVISLSKSSSLRYNNRQFVIDGLRICRDAAINSFAIDELYCTDTFIAEHSADYDLIKSQAIECYEVTESLMKKMSETVSPQGCICVCKMKASNIILNNTAKCIILENVQDPGNVGTIVRTAEAFGIDMIYVCGGCDIYSPKTLRASMGSLLRINLISCSIENAINELKNIGVPIFSAVLNNESININECDFTNGAAVVIGNEANGITQSTIDASDYSVKIPMIGNAESLNAAAAATVLMWEIKGKNN